MKQFYRTPNGQLWEREESGHVRGSIHIGQTYGDDEDDAMGEPDDEFDALLFAGPNEILYAAAKKASRKGGGKQLARLRKMALVRAAGGVAMPSKGDGYGMGLPLPFRADFTAGQTRDVIISPQNEMEVRDLVIVSANAQLFAMNQFQVGTDNQYVASGPLNLDLLSSQTNRPVSFKGSVASPGIQIQLNITNLDAANAQTLYGMFVGPVVRYGNRVAG